MLSDFPKPDSLPGGLKTGPPSDTTTYYNIWKVGEDLVERCVKARGEVGWQATGEILRYTLSLEIFASIHFFWGFLVYISLACAFGKKSPRLIFGSLSLHGKKALVLALGFSSGLLAPRKIT